MALQKRTYSDGYAVEFDPAGNGHNWFYTLVTYNNVLIAHKACCKNYVRAARWAKRRIRNHRAALKVLD